MPVMIDIHQFAIFTAHYQQFRLKRNIAILYSLKAKAPTVSSFEDLRTPFDYQTSVVNAIKYQAQTGFLGRFAIYTTTPPTLRCMGMSLRCNVDTIYFLEKQNLAVTLRKRDINPKFVSQTSVDYSDNEKVAEWEQLSVLSPPIPLEEMLKEAQAITPRFAQWWRMVMDDRDTWARWENAMASKRMPSPTMQPLPQELSDGPHLGGDQYSDAIYLSLAQALVAVRRRTSAAADANDVGAVLVGPHNEILSWGVNTMTKTDKSRHAETNCVERYHELYGGRQLPTGSILYTTLQSCEMCAAVIRSASESHVSVIYAETDPGIKVTALNDGKEPHLRVTEQRHASRFIVRPAAAVTVALRLALLRKAVQKTSPTAAVLATIENSGQKRQEQTVKQVGDAAVQRAQALSIQTMNGATTLAKFSTDLQKAKNAKRREDVVAATQFYREEWSKIKSDKQQYGKAPIDRYPLERGQKAFVEALDMLTGQHFEQLIAANAGNHAGLPASQIALNKSRMLLDFLATNPKLFAE